MASPTVLQGDVVITGTVYPKGAGLPAACVGDSQWDASDPLAASNQEHRFNKCFSQVNGSAATAERRVIHVAHAAGTVEAVRAGVVTANVGAATITVDVKKNGTTILTATIVLDSTNVAYVPESGAVPSPTYAADDVFEVVVTVAAGGGTLGQGLFVDVTFTEAAA